MPLDLLPPSNYPWVLSLWGRQGDVPLQPSSPPWPKASSQAASGWGETLFWGWGIMGSTEGRIFLLFHLPFHKEQKQHHVANHNLREGRNPHPKYKLRHLSK